MTGINTSLGINSVASTIAALGANGTQIVTTNTGAHVTGLEAAAYEFGSILASYPADGPPLTRNAAVFQVSDEDGNLTMMSLNDLADEIRAQLGFDPLLEFSAGIGTTSNGYSLADINHILNQIETRYSSMSFTQLTQVQGSEALEVGDGIDEQVQEAINELQQVLSGLNQALVNSPAGISPNSAVFLGPNQINELEEDQATALRLGNAVITSEQALKQAQAALVLAQAGFSSADQAAVTQAYNNFLNACTGTGAGNNLASLYNTYTAALATARANQTAAVATAQTALTLATTNLTNDRTSQAAFLAAAMGNNSPNTATLRAAASSAVTLVNTTLSNISDLQSQINTLNAAINQVVNIDTTLAQASQTFAREDQLRTLSTRIANSNALVNAIGQPIRTLTEINNGSAAYNIQTLIAFGSQPYAGMYTKMAVTGVEVGQQPWPATTYAATLPGILGIPQRPAAGVYATQADSDAQLAAVTERLSQIAPNFQMPANVTDWNAATLSSLLSQLQSQQPILSAQYVQAQQGNFVISSAAISAAQTNASTLSAHTTALYGGSVATARAQLDVLKTQLQQAFTTLSTQQTSQLSLQRNLLAQCVVPGSSWNDVMNEIQATTGVDLAPAMQSIIGDGNITPAELNRIYTYINENRAAGVAAIPLISNSQLQQIATTQLESALSQASFTAALAASPTGISASAAVFTIPGTSGQVSLNQLLATIQQSTGADLATPINAILDGGLITSDALLEINNGIIIPGSVATQNALAQLRVALGGSLVSNVLTNTPSGVNINTPSVISRANQTQITQNQAQINSLNQSIAADLQTLNNAIANAATAYAGWPRPNDATLIANARAALDAATTPEARNSALANLDNRMFGAIYGYLANSNAAQNAVNAAKTQLQNHRSELNALMASAMASNSPDAQANRTQLNQLNSAINANQAAIFSLENQIATVAGTMGTLAECNARIPVLQDCIAAGLTDNFREEWLDTFLEFQEQGLARVDADPAAQLAGLQQQLSAQVTLMQQNLAQLAPLQRPLLVSAAPLQSLSQVISGIAQSTGIDLTATVNSITDGSISQSSLGLLNTYLSSPIASGQNPARITINVAAVNNDFSVADDQLNNFTVEPRVAAALSNIGSALNQLTIRDLNSFGSLSIDAEIFNLPAIAQALGLASGSQISLSQILQYESSRGVSLDDALSNLSDSDGSVSWSNLNQLAVLINQAAPNANVDLDAALSIPVAFNDIDALISYFSPQGSNIGVNNPGWSDFGLNFTAWFAQMPKNVLTGIGIQEIAYSLTLAGKLGIPQIQLPPNSSTDAVNAALNTQYEAITNELARLVPSFECPASLDDWSAATIGLLSEALAVERADLTGRLNIQSTLGVLAEAFGSSTTIAETQRLSSSLANALVITQGSPLSRLKGRLLEADWYANNGYGADSNVTLGTRNSAILGIEAYAVTGLDNGGSSKYGSAQNLICSGYSTSLAGLLGVPQPNPIPNIDTISAEQLETLLDRQYEAVTTAIHNQVPNFSVPPSSGDWTEADVTALVNALNSKIAALQSTSLDIVAAKTALQNIQFADVEQAINAGTAAASVTASMRQGVDRETLAPLSAAEVNSQLEDGDLYVNSRGQFFLNRQPTNARDASVAAFVISGTSLNDKLANLMNKVNLNNTRIQMANYLSAATSAADLQTRIAEQRTQYGFADIMSEITGGSMSDSDITSSTDITTATGEFQSALKTAINNATNNQDLDTQNLQQLTSQIQANSTAMTQIIQAFEQMLKGLSQNLR